MKLLLLLAVTVALTGCSTRAGDHPVSRNCQWMEEDNHPLNLQIGADRRHLRNDAETAEDMAIRWADQNFHLRPEWLPQGEQCLASLFSGVARQHGVDVATVARYRGSRDVFVDAIVILSFGALYLVAAYLVAGRIRRRFPEGEPGFWVMSVAMAFGVGLVAVMVGMLGSIVIEGVRLNSGHLSYRMNRIPARQYWVQLYLCSIVIFGLAALVRSRVQRRGLNRAAKTANNASHNFNKLQSNITVGSE